MPHAFPRYCHMGDRALLVELGDQIGLEVNRRVRGLFVTLKDLSPDGIVEIIPGYCSLLLIIDPLGTTLTRLRETLGSILETLDNSRIPEPGSMEVPVVYGGEYGPDLKWVADYHGITPEEVVRLHTAHTYQVYMIGFMPGFPYMGELPKELITPRRETPRTSVPRGSVALAQAQTGIYPSQSPGGWQIIGRTPLTLFDPENRPPSLLEMGDRVRFFAITEEEMIRWQNRKP